MFLNATSASQGYRGWGEAVHGPAVGGAGGGGARQSGAAGGRRDPDTPADTSGRVANPDPVGGI